MSARRLSTRSRSTSDEPEEAAIDIVVSADAVKGVSSILKDPQRHVAKPYHAVDRSDRSLHEAQHGRPADRRVSFKLPSTHREKATRGTMLSRRRQRRTTDASVLLSIYTRACRDRRKPPLPCVIEDLTPPPTSSPEQAQEQGTQVFPAPQDFQCRDVTDISLEETQCLCDMLANHGTLRSLTLRGIGLTDDHLTLIAPTIAYRRSCEQLNIADNPKITFRGVQIVAQLLERSICLSYLNLSGINLNVKAANALKQYLPTSRLSTLILHSCGLKNTSALSAIVEGCRHCSSLANMSLKSNGMTPRCAHSLALLLAENILSRCLDLRSNALGDEGTEIIARALPNQNSLKRLVLFNNSITERGAIILFKTLQAMGADGLQALDISANPIASNDAMTALKNMLCSRNNRMTSLYMYNVGLRDDGLVTLGEALSENRTLQRLEIRSNRYGAAGLLALSVTVQTNNNIFKIMLDTVKKPKSQQEEEMASDSIQKIQRKCGENLDRIQTETVDGYDTKARVVLADDATIIESDDKDVINGGGDNMENPVDANQQGAAGQNKAAGLRESNNPQVAESPQAGQVALKGAETSSPADNSTPATTAMSVEATNSPSVSSTEAEERHQQEQRTSSEDDSDDEAFEDASSSQPPQEPESGAVAQHDERQHAEPGDVNSGDQTSKDEYGANAAAGNDVEIRNEMQADSNGDLGTVQQAQEGNDCDDVQQQEQEGNDCDDVQQQEQEGNDCDDVQQQEQEGNDCDDVQQQEQEGNDCDDVQQQEQEGNDRDDVKEQEQDAQTDDIVAADITSSSTQPSQPQAGSADGSKLNQTDNDPASPDVEAANHTDTDATQSSQAAVADSADSVA